MNFARSIDDGTSAGRQYDNNGAHQSWEGQLNITSGGESGQNAMKCRASYALFEILVYMLRASAAIQY